MQFAIIKLTMHMIEQEWKTTKVGDHSYEDLYGDIAAFSLDLAQRVSRVTAPTHQTKLAMSWYWLNKLKANY